MKVLFLDIDGVLNCNDTFKSNPKPNFPIDPEMMNRLNTIIEVTGCSVVLSSLWRLEPKEGWRGVQGVLEKCGFLHTLIDATPNMPIKDRGHEIQGWMTDHGVRADDICILDDDSDMVHLLHRHVKTSMEKGLTQECMAKAIEMLNT